MIDVAVRRLRPDARLPEQAYEGDAGLDLAACEEAVLAPGERAIVSTGVAVEIPDGYAGFVQPRSGLAARHGIGIVNAPGLIDSGYRGEISVLLINHGAERVTFSKGDRIAQLAVVPVPVVEWVEVDTLDGTQRGASGFGSTGT